MDVFDKGYNLRETHFRIGPKTKDWSGTDYVIRRLESYELNN